MMMPRLHHLLATAFAVLLISGARGQDGGAGGATPPGDEPQRLLPADPRSGEWTRFSSPEAGLELELPPGAQQPSDDPNVLVQVANVERQWLFELRRLPLDVPIGLKPQEMPEGGRRAGLLEIVAGNDQRALQAELLREPSLTPLGDADAGVYAMRYTAAGLSPQLRQVGLIRASETLYYQVSLTSPAPRGTKQELENDNDIREAVEAFNRSFNSFKVLDQTALRLEQDERLIRTRTLLVNLTKARMLAALQPEQWWRIRREGRDIGYSYLVEVPARQIPARPEDLEESLDEHAARGVTIGVRTRLQRDGGWLDRETWLFAASDLREEDFRERNQLLVGDQRQAHNLVVGTMRAMQTPRAVEMEGPLGKQRGFTVVDLRRLDVTYVVNGVQTNPLNRQLPAWYLPQAVNHLLPRLVAPWGRNTYLVAVYNPEKREIYQQYVDVEGLSQERVQGEMRLVMVVTTRMGLSGPRTRHFIDPDTFDWLGSINEQDRIEIWPSDEATLREIWENPDLTAPDARGQ